MEVEFHSTFKTTPLEFENRTKPQVIMCKVNSCKIVVNREKQKVNKDGQDENPQAIRSELKKVLQEERDRLRRASRYVDSAEDRHDGVVEAVSAILLDDQNMDAMVAYANKKDSKNSKGKKLYEKYKELTESMAPAVKEQVRKIMLDRIKYQYKKDAKGAEKFMANTLGKLFPDLLPTFFKTHDYNKGKGPDR